MADSMSGAHVGTWLGIGNELITVAEKASARVGHDLPEDVEKRAGENVPILRNQFKKLWRAGLLDAEARDGKLYILINTAREVERRKRGMGS